MTVLTLIPSFASNQDLNNKGTSLPPWNASSRSAIASLVSNTSNWWSDSSSDVFYSIQNSGNNFDVEFQYGQNLQIWASAKFIKYSYGISNEVINADNSITFDLTISFLGVVSNKTSYSKAGVSVVNKLYLGTQTIMSRSGNTIDNFQVAVNNDNPIVFKKITLSPRSSFNAAQLQWGSQYPNHEYTDAILNIGMLIFNPLYSWYVPMITRKNRAWLPLNGNAGKILRRVNHYIAYAYNNSGSDRFTTLYPQLNLVSGTENNFVIQGTNQINQYNTMYLFSNGKNLYQQNIGTDTNITISYDWVISNPSSGSFNIQYNNTPWGAQIDYVNNISSNNSSGHVVMKFSSSANENLNTAIATGIAIRLDYVPTNTQITISNFKYQVKNSNYPLYYGSYYGQGTQSQNASDYSWTPMIFPIPQTEMGWSDFSIETQGTENQANKGHNRRRTAGQFLQLPKLN